MEWPAEGEYLLAGRHVMSLEEAGRRAAPRGKEAHDSDEEDLEAADFVETKHHVSHAICPAA